MKGAHDLWSATISSLVFIFLSGPAELTRTSSSQSMSYGVPHASGLSASMALAPTNNAIEGHFPSGCSAACIEAALRIVHAFRSAALASAPLLQPAIDTTATRRMSLEKDMMRI